MLRKWRISAASARPVRECTLLLGSRTLVPERPGFPQGNPVTSPANATATFTRCSDSQLVRVCW